MRVFASTFKKGYDRMKKNIIISVLALMLALTSAACGNKDNKSALVGSGSKQTESDSKTASDNKGSDASKSDSSSSDTQEESAEYQLDHFAENSDKKINMNKIEGKKAQTDSSGKSGDGKMTTCTVAIDEVKVAKVEDMDIVFVVFDFKNTTDSELNFSGEVFAEAYQDGMELSPAVFQNPIEGYSPDTTAQRVAGGESIKVQKAFFTSAPDAPIEIYVRDSYDNTGEKYLSQVFRTK